MTDYISRADAVKTVIRMCSPICDWQDGTQQYPDCVVAEINALPSADADAYTRITGLEPDAVQGEWQKVEEQPYFRKHYDTVCCSVCRKKGNRKWNFCPNCGARMFKGGDDE